MLHFLKSNCNMQGDSLIIQFGSYRISHSLPNPAFL